MWAQGKRDRSGVRRGSLSETARNGKRAKGYPENLVSTKTLTAADSGRSRSQRDKVHLITPETNSEEDGHKSNSRRIREASLIEAGEEGGVNRGRTG